MPGEMTNDPIHEQSQEQQTGLNDSETLVLPESYDTNTVENVSTSNTLQELKALIQDPQKFEKLAEQREVDEKDAKLEKLGVQTLLKEMTDEELSDFWKQQPEGSKGFTTTSIFDENGFTGRRRLYRLNPEVMEKKKAEVDQVLNEDKGNVSKYQVNIMLEQVQENNAEDLGEMEYTDLFDKEDYNDSDHVYIFLYDKKGQLIRGRGRVFRWK